MGHKHWRYEDIEFIRTYAPILKDKDLVRALAERTGYQISLVAFRKLRARLGIHKLHGRTHCEVDPYYKDKWIRGEWVDNLSDL